MRLNEVIRRLLMQLARFVSNSTHRHRKLNQYHSIMHTSRHSPHNDQVTKWR